MESSEYPNIIEMVHPKLSPNLFRKVSFTISSLKITIQGEDYFSLVPIKITLMPLERPLKRVLSYQNLPVAGPSKTQAREPVLPDQAEEEASQEMVPLQQTNSPSVILQAEQQTSLSQFGHSQPITHYLAVTRYLPVIELIPVVEVPPIISLQLTSPPDASDSALAQNANDESAIPPNLTSESTTPLTTTIVASLMEPVAASPSSTSADISNGVPLQQSFSMEIGESPTGHEEQNAIFLDEPFLPPSIEAAQSTAMLPASEPNQSLTTQEDQSVDMAASFPSMYQNILPIDSPMVGESVLFPNADPREPSAVTDPYLDSQNDSEGLNKVYDNLISALHESNTSTSAPSNSTDYLIDLHLGEEQVPETGKSLFNLTMDEVLDEDAI